MWVLTILKKSIPKMLSFELLRMKNAEKRFGPTYLLKMLHDWTALAMLVVSFVFSSNNSAQNGDRYLVLGPSVCG